MKIIINGNHSEKLAEALDKIQSRCTARILSCEKIEEILADAIKKIDIPKTTMKGTVLIYTGAEHFPKSYKYRPESTHFTAEHNGLFWVITDISRNFCPNRTDNSSIILSETAQTALLKKFKSIYL